MTPSSPLETQVCVRLQETFGNPCNDGGNNRRWSVRPMIHMPAINITLECERPYPRVWIFDPNDRLAGIISEDIFESGQIDPLFQKINEHVTRAAGRAL